MKAIGRVLSLTLIALAAPAATYAQPNPEQPYIQNISYGGSGCPQGTVGTSIASNRLSFTLIFDQFVASSGPGVPVTEGRKNCQLNINVHIPAGPSQFCTVLDSRGYVQLPAGVIAQGKTAGYIQGELNYELPDGQVIAIGDEEEEGPEEGDQQFVGPLSRDYLGRENDFWSITADEAKVVPINFNRQVRLLGPSNLQAQITTDSIDGKIVPCDGPAPTDTTAPTISISNPVQFGLYGLDASVTPAFTCTDEEGGSGVASCTAVPSLDTSSIGPKIFTVTAVDNAGNSSTASVTYAVGGKNECKGGGHAKFLAPTFGNQGQCVSSFAK